MAIDNSQKIQNFTNRGRQSLEIGHYDVAIELLTNALQLSPKTIEIRRLLRTAQIAQFRKNPPSNVALALQKISSFVQRSSIMSLVKKGKGEEAMAAAEDLMAINPLDPDNIECAVKAAEVAKIQKDTEAATLEAVQLQAKQKVAEAEAKKQAIALAGAITELQQAELDLQAKIAQYKWEAIGKAISGIKLPTMMNIGGEKGATSPNALESLIQTITVEKLQNISPAPSSTTPTK